MDPDVGPDGIVVELVLGDLRRIWCQLPLRPCGAIGDPGDLATVDLLARLQSAAGRSGARIEVRGVPASTASFIHLVGLATTLGLRED